MDLVCGNVSVTLYPHPSPPLKNAGGYLRVKLKLIIMAKGKNGAKAPQLSLIGLIKSKGYKVSEQWEKLWSAPETLAEGIEPSTIEIRVSDKYEDSVYAILRDGKESTIVAFAQGELDPSDLETGDNGVVTGGLDDMTFTLAEVTALADREDLGISEGDTRLKLYVE